MKRHLSPFCFAVIAFAFVASPVTAQEWGTLKGTFIFEGKAPDLTKIVVAKDAEVCAKVPPPREEILVDKDGGLANALIYVLADPKNINKPAAIHPDYDKRKKETAVLDNKNCRFEPRLLTVWTEQKFAVKSSDPVISHNSYGSPFVNKAFNPILPPGGTVTVPLDKPEKAPFTVTCSIHPWMKGYVIVRPDPYMAVSAATGEFKIENLPVGEHTFQFWHESLLYLRTLTIGGKAFKDTATTRGQHKLTIKAGDNDIGKIVIKAADYDAAIKKIPK